MNALADTARATVERHKLLPDGAPVLAMVSGGGDSVAMLHLLAEGAFGAHPLRVLHVNHMLRGDDADGDEAFVRELCLQLGAECRVIRYDVAAYAASERLNLEDAGRRTRYRFAADELDAFCAELGVAADAGRLAVAHTRDDRVEVFLMRAIGGGSTRSLAGIRPRRGRVVRPLLDCDRTHVRAWLDAMGLAWREDESNSDTARRRAYLRAHVIPAAEKLNPSFRETLARTMDVLAGDDELLSELAVEAVRRAARIEPGLRASVDSDKLVGVPHALVRRVVRTAILEAFPDASRLENAHLEAVVSALGEPAFARDLSQGLRAVSECGSMVISRREADCLRVAPALLTLPGTAELGAAGSIRARETELGDLGEPPFSVVVDAETVSSELTVDAWREGDRMRPFGMEGTRKLSDLLGEAKVPVRLRGAVPVVRDGERVVWLAGVRMAEPFRVTELTRRAVRLTWADRPWE